MKNLSLQDRAAGALMGAFIGDALGMGVHWYYDLAEMRKNHGDFVRDYCNPIAGRYHDHLKAGDLTQSGILLEMTLRHLVQHHGYQQEAFCTMLDEELFPQLDGKPMSGPGGYTNQSIRTVYEQRKAGRTWKQTGSMADTTEGIERTLAMGVLYSTEPAKMAEAVASNTVLTQSDDVVVSMTVAYSAVLGHLIQGHPLDEEITDRLFELVHSGALPFHAVTSDNFGPPEKDSDDPPRAGKFASPDALFTPGSCAAAATDAAHIQIEPAWRVSTVYGMPCAIYHVLPAAYYLAARFHSDFESAVLHAVNGGGQNCARTMLTGALVGAEVGLSGIPARFVDGLRRKEELMKLVKEVVDLITPGSSA